MSTYASSTLALGPDFLSADTIAKAGLVVVLLIVFAESGLLIGFFLPGDSLLFTLGLLIASGDDVSTPLWLACLLIAIAAVAGDQVGYLFGRKAGPALFRRPNSRLFKQENVEKAHEFFEKYGPRSIVLARFVPIIRTFTPVIAGVSWMNYRTFVIYNIIGGVLWGSGVTILGFYLGKIDFVRHNIEAMALLIVLISVLPIAFELLRARSKAKKAAATAASHDAAAGSGGPGHRPETRHLGEVAGPGWNEASGAGPVPGPGRVSGGGGAGGGGRTGGGKHSVAAVQRRGGTPPSR